MSKSAFAPLLALALACNPAGQTSPTQSPETTTAMPPAADAYAYPETKRDEIVDTLHGQKVADPYRWLENIEDAEVKAWMDAQDSFARTHLSGLPGRDALRERVRELTYLDYVSPPNRKGTRFFYTRIKAKDEKETYLYRDGRDGKEQVLIDANKLSEDGSISVHGVFPSDDGKLVAYKLSKNNSDQSTMYVRNVDTGEDSKVDVIKGGRYAYASWLNDGSGFVYTSVPPDAPPTELNAHASIRFHKLGTPEAEDIELVAPHGDPSIFMGGYISTDGHWLIVSRGRGAKNEVSFRNIRGKKGLQGPLTQLAPPEKASYSVDNYKDQFYITTDEGAPNERVFKVDPKRPERKNWKEIVPETSSLLKGGYIVGGHLVLSYMKNAFSQLEVRDLDGKLVRKVSLPGLGSASGLIGREDDDKAYLVYSSLTEAPTIYETSVATGATKVWNRVEIPVDTSKIESEQVWYTSRDGTKVSMFVVKPKGMKLDGTAPTYLYGYGGFSVSLTPSFNPRAALWAEHGGVFAMPNLRGGGEYGEAWHEAGMREKKQNVFDDFIGAAEFLIAEGYTSSSKLAISGGSNGGLLVGAAMTQRPELFRAVVCAVPLLDMIRFTKFGSGTTWMPEYGNPDVAEDFGFIYGYSPYHHVEENVDYPAMLMLSADSDDRVDPMHARKFTAAVQHASTSEHPAVIRIEKNAGHGGADKRDASVEQSVDTLAFLLSELGVQN